ncbi:hypothetical protein FRC10_012006 [Ceratobasidium sp. 414]|nr:hypothetical protein FRC10_012006 [Ceratobasidium sp. 414]
MDRCNKITTSTDPIVLLAAYNTAVKQEVQLQEQIAPEGLKELQATADQLRLKAGRPFQEQPAEIQNIGGMGVLDWHMSVYHGMLVKWRPRPVGL